MKQAVVCAIRFYSERVSPCLPPHCRFHPSCSHYTREAIEKHGLGRGTYLGLRRILKCHPWHPGGIDLVPDTQDIPSPSPSSRP